MEEGLVFVKTFLLVDHERIELCIAHEADLISEILHLIDMSDPVSIDDIDSDSRTDIIDGKWREESFCIAKFIRDMLSDMADEVCTSFVFAVLEMIECESETKFIIDQCDELFTMDS